MGKQGSCISQLRLQWQNSTDWVVKWAYQVVLVVKNLPANARDIRDARWIPGSTRSPGGGHGNPLQYSYLEKPMDRGAWQATVHRVTKSRTWLKGLNTHTSLGWAGWQLLAEAPEKSAMCWASPVTKRFCDTCLWILTGHLIHPPVLWVKITLPQAADEEVRKYPGHCRAQIRPGAWSALSDAVHGVPACCTSYTQPQV